MATQLLISVAGASTPSAALVSTRVKVVSNVACYYAVGTAPVAYTTGNCALLPANTVRDIIVGEGSYTSQWTQLGNVVTGTTPPKIAFITSTATTAGITVIDVGSVDFARTAD
jgi:hypothetical protein